MLQFLRRGQQADDVEINAPGKDAIIDDLSGRDLVRGEIGFEEPVDGIGQSLGGGRDGTFRGSSLAGIGLLTSWRMNPLGQSAP